MKLKFCLGPAVSLAAAVIIMGLGAGCAGGDDQAPIRVRDLSFFTQADALDFHHRVSTLPAAGPNNTRLLAWTAPGDDGTKGQASGYDFRFIMVADLARFHLTDPAQAFQLHWDQAHQLYQEPYPLSAGKLEEFFLPRVAMGDTVWFAMKTRDEIGQDSGISNLAGPLRIGRLEVPVRPAAGDTVAGFGLRLAPGGDLNGDKRMDLIVANPSLATVSVIYGRPDQDLIQRKPNTQGVKVLRALPELTPALVITGNTAEAFGQAVAGISRINDDGIYDFAVGAPAADSGAITDAGAVYVFYGSKTLPTALAADDANVILTGLNAGDRFGAAIAPLLDINQDQRNEFVVGAPGALSGRGAVYIFKASTLAAGDASTAAVEIWGGSAGDGFGSVVAPIGDVNGDQLPDFAVAAPEKNGGAGFVYVFYGGNAGMAKFSGLGTGRAVIDLSQPAVKADVTIRGSFPARRFGKSITAGGNLQGHPDSAYDFAVSGGNTVYVFFGGTGQTLPFPPLGPLTTGNDADASARLSGSAAEDFAFALAGPGDLNLDQADDLVVAAPEADRCYIYSGPIQTGQTPAETMLSPRAPGQRFGAALSGVNDLNLDGFVDLIIGAPLAGEAFFSF